jgi:SMI1 / KNR4 family (SUKH-1)
MGVTDQARADKIIDEVCHRLRTLAANRRYRFVRTARRDAENYQSLQTAFTGYSESQIAQAEERLRVAFPLVFRTFLRRMGEGHGDLFCGSDVADLAGLERFRENAQALMQESQVAEALPPNAVVFLFHQGYTFCYILAAGGFDSPVWGYVEGEARPEERCAGFEEFLLAEVTAMEEVNRRSIDQGGYFLQVSPDGSTAQHYPALNSGIRPLEMEDEYIE